MRLSYIRNGETLLLDRELCNGCGACIDVCPHAVFIQQDHRVDVSYRAGCMECGACARNCPQGAIRVRVGVGCAAAIIGGMLRGTAPRCGCSDSTSGCCG